MPRRAADRLVVRSRGHPRGEWWGRRWGWNRHASASCFSARAIQPGARWRKGCCASSRVAGLTSYRPAPDPVSSGRRLSPSWPNAVSTSRRIARSISTSSCASDSITSSPCAIARTTAVPSFRMRPAACIGASPILRPSQGLTRSALKLSGVSAMPSSHNCRSSSDQPLAVLRIFGRSELPAFARAIPAASRTNELSQTWNSSPLS